MLALDKDEAGIFQELMDDYKESSTDEVTVHGGSIPGHVVINRNQDAASHRLFVDYFTKNFPL